MGQSLNKLALPGSEEKKVQKIGPIIDECYNTHFTNKNKPSTYADFYRAVSETVEEINRKLGNTQFRAPEATELEKSYKNHHEREGKGLSKDEFRNILKDVIIDSGFSGVGAKDTLLYLFGVPLTALMIKKKVIPNVISNDVFIPVVTSLTVLVLAKVHKI